MTEIKAKATAMGINPGRMAKTELIRSIHMHEGHAPASGQPPTNATSSPAAGWKLACPAGNSPAAPHLSRKLGRTGINIVTRIMGLILAAIAVEFIANGVKNLFPLLA